MFSLISGLWNMLVENPTYKVLIIGLDESGKTVEIFKCKIICIRAYSIK